MKLKNLLRFFLGIPLTILAFIFIGKVFFDNRTLLSSHLTSINLELFVLGTLFYSAFFAVKALIWLKILKARGHEVKKRETIFIYSLSEIKRYIPGSIFAFIGRVDTHKDVPKKETLKSIGIEAVLLVVSASIVSFPALYFLLKNFLPDYVYLAKPLLALGSLFVFFVCIRSVKTRGIIANYFDSFLLYVIAWTLYSIGSLLILLSLTFIDPKNFILAGSFFALSWVGGYLSFVTPMGLGARELIAVFGLGFFVATPIASVIAVITRLCMIVGELVFLILSKAYADLKPNSKLLKLNPYLAIVILMAILYFLYFSYISLFKHDTFLTGRFDLGNMAQTVWNTYHGRFFMLTNPDGVNNMSRLGVHSDIFLVFLAPLYLIWENPKILLLFQTLALSISGIFIYLTSKKIVKNETVSIIFAFSFFANFWIHEQNLFDFHAVSVATLFVIAAFYFYLIKKPYLFLASIFLALTTKENVFLLTFMFGIYFLIKKKRLAGLIFSSVSIASFYLLVTQFIPNARGEAHFALGGYEYLGSGPIQIILNSITNPALLVGQLFNNSTFYYFHTHLIGTGYLAIFSPIYLIFTLPDMAIYLLSSNYGYRSYHYHFGALIVPFFYIASIFSLQKLQKKFSKLVPLKLLGLYVLASAVYSLYNYSPVIGMKNGDNAPFEVKGSQKIISYLSLIPHDAKVASSNSIGAHLSHRENIYVVPFGMDFADYIVLYNESADIEDNINVSEYDLIAYDSELNFKIYRKREILSCLHCKP